MASVVFGLQTGSGRLEFVSKSLLSCLRRCCFCQTQISFLLLACRGVQRKGCKMCMCSYVLTLLQILGDQQAALVGQGCLKRGQAKNTCVISCVVNVFLLSPLVEPWCELSMVRLNWK